MDDTAAQELSALLSELLRDGGDTDWAEYVRKRRAFHDRLAAALRTDAEHWHDTLDNIVVATHGHLQSCTPLEWAEFLQQLTGFLGKVEVDEGHPMADDETLIHPVGPTPGHVALKTRLAGRMLKLLLSEYDGDDRATLVHALKDWPTLTELGAALPDLAPSAQDLSLLLGHVEAYAEHDMAADLLLEPFQTWAKVHPDVAQQAVDAWLSKPRGARLLAPISIQRLVEAIVSARPDRLPWCRKLILQLEDSGDPHLWKLATKIGYFAGRNTEQRGPFAGQIALKARVQRRPELLTSVALAIMAREAFDYPEEALTTALEFVQSAPDFARVDNTVEWANYLALVARNAVQAARRSGVSLASPERVLPLLLEIRPSNARANLDSLLHELWAMEGTARGGVEVFIRTWFIRHWEVILSDRPAFEEVLPLVQHTMTNDGWRAFMTRGLIAPEQSLRAIMGHFISRMSSIGPPFRLSESMLRQLSSNQYTALGHGLASLPRLIGSVWVPLIAQMLEIRPDSTGALIEMLSRAALEEYPGLVTSIVQRWKASDERVIPERLVEVGKTLADGLERQREVVRQQRLLPEINATVATSQIFHELFSASFTRSLAEVKQSGSFLFSTLASEVPIGRGEGAHIGGSFDATVKFGTVESRVTLPRRAAYDPLGSKMAQVFHRKEADRLFDGGDAETNR